MTLAEALEQWLQNFSQYGYFGIFLSSLLGSASIIFPIPYTVILFTLAPMETFNPILMALASSIGSAVGEFSGYLLGLGGRKIIGEKGKRNMEFLLKIFGKYSPIAIFIFTLTPLPDDLLFIPLGVMRYKFLKALVPAFIGKLTMSLIIVYSSRLAIGTIKDLFNIESDLTITLISMIVALILLAAIFIIMFKVDWEKTFEKHFAKKKGKGDKN
ncbi:MAG: VTT domain-containing protein [Nitrososphaerota archaeon]|nr:VTT domain-containing protein [Candidatus Bathyarchaeota archaeon]MDW8022125.1 VTT domain-containing protein [Nitrososphaerota archaeon]